MTPTQIQELFKTEVAKKDFKKRSELERQIVYNYRHRKLPTLGTMLAILLKLESIKIVKNET